MRRATRSIVALIWCAIAIASRAQTPAERRVVIADVTVVDVVAGRLVPHQTVVIAGDSIERVAPAADVAPVLGATAIPGEGRYLIPGLFDCHVHFSDPATQGPMCVANGVTFARDMGGFTATSIALRERFYKGEALGPDLIVCGAILDGDPPIWPTSEKCPNPDAGREAVRKLAEAGVDQIKVYQRLPRFAYLAIVDEAKKHDLPAVGHVPDSVRLGEALSIGQASIEHLSGWERVVARFAGGNPDSAPTFVEASAYWSLYPKVDLSQLRAFLKDVKDANCVQCPTLAVVEGIATTFDPSHARQDLLAYVPSAFRAAWKADRYGFGKHLKSALPHMKALVGELHRAQVPLVCGTDLANPHVFAGFSLHRELELFQEAGIAAPDVLRCATSNAAELCGVAEKFGTVATGKIASLVLLSKDPLADVRNAAAIDGVFLKGRWFDRKALNAMLAEVRREVAAPEAETAPASRPEPAPPAMPGTLVAKGRYVTRLGSAQISTETFAISSDAAGFHVWIDSRPKTGFGRASVFQAEYAVSGRFMRAECTSGRGARDIATYVSEGKSLRASMRHGDEPTGEVTLPVEPTTIVATESNALDFVTMRLVALVVGESKSVDAIGLSAADWKPQRTKFTVERKPDEVIELAGQPPRNAAHYAGRLQSAMGTLNVESWCDASGLVLRSRVMSPLGVIETNLE